MHVGQAARKLSRTRFEVYDSVNAVWELPSHGLQLGNSGRWIGKSEDFYNRRLMLSPMAIGSQYQVLRMQGHPEVYLIYGNALRGQPNIQMGEAYMFEYTLLNTELEQAHLIGLTLMTVASGISGKKSETILGTFPVAMDRYAGATDADVPSVQQSKMNCVLPAYSNAQAQMMILWRGEYYVIKEATLELNLTHLYCIKR